MIDISPLEKYSEQPDNFMINYIPQEIKRLGLDRFLRISIDALDSSKVWDDGLRPIQTTSYIYVRAITEILYTINTYVDNIAERDKWFEDILTRHQANIEYEKEHPTINYDAGKKIKSKSGTTKQSTPCKRKNDEPTVAQIKAANKVAKLNMLKINIK